MAQEFDVPLLLLSQLPRTVEQRESKRPELGDLQEFGSVEDGADVVMFIFREEHYHERAMPKHRSSETEERFNYRYDRWIEHGERIRSLAEVVVAKNRRGPVGTVTLYFDSDSTKFSDLA